MTDLATLNPAALVTLADCEQRIERGLKTFIDVGQALAEIRDSRLYKGTHATFEAYLEGRWGMSRAHAYRMINAAEVVSPIGDTGLPAPTNEGQARALAAVPEPERAEVWRETVERTNGKPTAAAVRAVQTERNQTPGSDGAVEVPPADPGNDQPKPDPRPAVAAALDQHVPDPDAPARAWRKAFYDRHQAAANFLTWLNADDFVRYADDRDVETLRLLASMVSEAYHRTTVRLGNQQNVVSLRSVR